MSLFSLFSCNNGKIKSDEKELIEKLTFDLELIKKLKTETKKSITQLPKIDIQTKKILKGFSNGIISETSTSEVYTIIKNLKDEFHKKNYIIFVFNIQGNKSNIGVIKDNVGINVFDYSQIKEEIYGIDKENAHKRAIELVSEEFFWNGIDELAPFGSDEGDMALSEFRDWRKRNPKTETYECLKWTIEGVAEIDLSEYNNNILDENLIKSQIEDDNFDDHQYIFTVDISVIATGFGQLVDEGKIDIKNKPLIQLAIDRQKKWAELSTEWKHKAEYINNLNVLERVLKEA